MGATGNDSGEVNIYENVFSVSILAYFCVVSLLPAPLPPLTVTFLHIHPYPGASQYPA